MTPDAGGRLPVGLVLSLLSLIPTAVWLVLIARGMLRVRKACGEPS
ncbi:MAG: hypothetical protein ACOH16_14010 [Propionibacteriaceae bacterium]